MKKTREKQLIPTYPWLSFAVEVNSSDRVKRFIVAAAQEHGGVFA